MRPRDLHRLRAPVLVVLALAGVACNHPLAPKATGSAGAGGATGLAGAAGSTGITGTGGDVTAIPDGGRPLDSGRPALRRLTNLEYDNTIRDLLGVPSQARATFQPEELSGQFDVIGDGQSWNDARFEQYANAAETLAAAAFADPTLRARIVTCQPAAPGDTACTRTIVTAFGLRAWRRPLADDETTGLIAVANGALAGGATFDAAIQRVVTALLSSAPFLMRLEFDPSPSSTVAHALTPYELASRLSYLLWSSMPDDRLFALAEGGTLLTDAVITAEVDRMLADPRADGFVEGFAVQWLQADRLASLLLDPMVDATFDQPLRDAMGQEMRLYFGAFLSDDRDFRTFPSADINFVNDRLASLYGMTPPGSATLARVTDTADARAGFLGLGGFLAMTSASGRSSPTARGAWVLAHLLCAPPPVEPPGTPDSISPGQPLNGIALAASISAQPACAACHATMDGVGLALEPFDELGRLRGTYRDGTAIDGKGSFLGQIVVGEPALATAVSADPRLLSCASREVMSFAVNRTLGDADVPYANQILTQWTGGTPTLRGLIKAVVTNDTFKFRHGEAP